MAEQKDDNDPINRLAKCLHFYHTLKPSEYESLLEYFTKENYPHLIDDFNSILMINLGDDKVQTQSRKEYESIYNKMTTVIKDAKIEDSAIFKRNQREREKTKLFEDDSILNVKGDELQKLKFYIETLDTIYTYFLYAYDAGFRLKDSDVYTKDEYSRERGISDASQSGGDDHNMDDVVVDDKYVNELNNDSLFQHIQDMIKSKRAKLSKIIGGGLSDSRYVTKIDEDESVKYPEVVPPLQRKVTPENDEKKDNDDEKTWIINSFGYTFYYWNHYKDKKGGEKVRQNNGYTYGRLYVAAKYKNLEDELLNNTIKCISKEQFDSTVYNAEMRMKSQNAKTYETYGLITQNYGLKKKAPITKEHLISVILYCNYTELSNQFSKTHRKISQKDRISDVKKRNSEFAVWSKLLRETVECYGRTMQFAKNKALYHGVNGKLVFPNFCARFSCPTSLTTQLAVASIFAEENGIILEVERGSGKLRFFNTNWLSCFATDEERLVMGGEHDIKISLIYSVKDSVNYGLYLRAFAYFKYWISAREPNTTEYGTTTLKAKKTDYMILKSMFKHFDDRTDFKNKFPKYPNLVFDIFRQNIKEISIDYKQIEKHYKRIAPLLFDLDTRQILISEICMFFKYCRIITVTYKQFDKPIMDDWEFLSDLKEVAKYTKKALTVIINNIECDENSFHVINNSAETKGIWKAKKKGKNGIEVTYVNK